MKATIEATHSDGDGVILVAIDRDGEAPIYRNLDKDQAITFMADLAIAISDEYGKFNSYSYPGCKANQPSKGDEL